LLIVQRERRPEHRPSDDFRVDGALKSEIQPSLCVSTYDRTVQL
jgi:hypothetical protein